MMRAINFKDATVRLKTKGNSILIESVASLDDKSPNYSGEDVQGGWGDKIMNYNNSESESDKHESSDDDGEWDLDPTECN